MFYVNVIASNMIIRLVGVYAFILVRVMTPCVTAILEHFVLSHQTTLTIHSFSLLLLILSGGVLYAYEHVGSVMPGLDWIVVYFVGTPINNIIRKKVLNQIDLHKWDFVLYQSVLSCCVMPLVAVEGKIEFHNFYSLT